MKIKAQVIDDNGLQRTITRLAHEILERNKGSENIVLIGMRTRGEFLAQRIQKKINEIEKILEVTRNIAYETGVKVGELKSIGVIQKILHGEKIRKIEAIATMGTIIEAFQAWCFKNGEFKISSDLAEVKKKFDEVMRNVS